MADKFLDVLGAEVNEFNSLEAVFGDMLLFRSLKDAFGVQLDGIGEIVGESRQAREDEEYRAGIIYKIALNTSGGQAEVIIDFIQRATGCLSVFFAEIQPAKVSITYIGGVGYAGLRKQVDSLCAGGVQLFNLIQSDTEASFVFALENDAGIGLDNPDGLGFDEHGWADPSGRGGRLSELYI